MADGSGDDDELNQLREKALKSRHAHDVSLHKDECSKRENHRKSNQDISTTHVKSNKIELSNLSNTSSSASSTSYSSYSRERSHSVSSCSSRSRSLSTQSISSYSSNSSTRAHSPHYWKNNHSPHRQSHLSIETHHGFRRGRSPVRDSLQYVDRPRSNRYPSGRSRHYSPLRHPRSNHPHPQASNFAPRRHSPYHRQNDYLSYRYTRTGSRALPPTKQVWRRSLSPRVLSPRRLSPRRLSPRRSSPKQLSPRRSSPRRLSPRRSSPRRLSPKRSPHKQLSPRRLRPSYEQRNQPAIHTSSDDRKHHLIDRRPRGVIARLSHRSQEAPHYRDNSSRHESNEGSRNISPQRQRHKMSHAYFSSPKHLAVSGDINQEHAESQKATSSKNNSASLGQRRTVLQEEGAREKRKRKRSNSDSLQQKVAKPHESQIEDDAKFDNMRELNIDALDEELDYDETMDDIECYLQEEDERQIETTLKSEVRVCAPNKDQILDELSSEHEAVSSHKELKVEEGNKMEFSEKPKGEERHLSEIQSEGQSLEEVQLLGGEGEQQRLHSNPVDDEQPKKDNIAQQLETTGTGELSPHVEDSDNDNVPIISSPIRLTPEPDEVSQRKVVRTRRDVRGRRSHNDNEVRLSVKERLYISKKDIEAKTKEKEDYREQHKISSNLERRLGPLPNEKGHTSLRTRTNQRVSGKRDAVVIAETFRRPRKVEMDTWQADEEIKKGQRFAKIVNDHQSRISTDRLARKDEDLDKRISRIRTNNRRILERGEEVRKDRQLHG